MIHLCEGSCHCHICLIHLRVYIAMILPSVRRPVLRVHLPISHQKRRQTTTVSRVIHRMSKCCFCITFPTTSDCLSQCSCPFSISRQADPNLTCCQHVILCQVSRSGAGLRFGDENRWGVPWCGVRPYPYCSLSAL
jgi:hypothetical protein